MNLLVRKQNYQDERVLIRSKQDKTLNIRLLSIPKLPKKAYYNFGLADKPDFSFGYGLGTAWK